MKGVIRTTNDAPTVPHLSMFSPGESMTLALYTTIHPGTRPFLKDWYASVVAQTDTDVDLWIGLDGMTVSDVENILGVRPDAEWVRAHDGDTPAQVRSRAWKALIPHADAVVMVDADDVLLPERIARSRAAAAHADLSGCALALVDQSGHELGVTMPPAGCADPESVLPLYNLFGLTNSTYRTELLERLLPLPSSAVLVDWYLATKAWLGGATLAFDPRPAVQYRQHPDSTLALYPPFRSTSLRKTALAVRDHFQAVVDLPGPDLKRARVQAAASHAERFAQCATSHPRWLATYTALLNDNPPSALWWSVVAHPDHYPFCIESPS